MVTVVMMIGLSRVGPASKSDSITPCPSALREFVLSRVVRADEDLLDQAEEIAVKAVETLIGEGVDQAMSRYNGIDLREKEN